MTRIDIGDGWTVRMDSPDAGPGLSGYSIYSPADALLCRALFGAVANHNKLADDYRDLARISAGLGRQLRDALKRIASHEEVAKEIATKILAWNLVGESAGNKMRDWADRLAAPFTTECFECGESLGTGAGCEVCQEFAKLRCG